MEFSGDGKVLAAGADREIRLFEPATGALLATAMRDTTVLLWPAPKP